MALNAKRIYLSIYPSIYLSIYLEVICLSVSLNAVFKRHTQFIYLSVCLNAFFYRQPHIPTPSPPPPTKMLEFIHLSVCLSACLFVFPPVSLSVFSVCIRKQVRITRKFHNHYDDETQYTDSHTTARKHSKLISQFSGSFPQQNDCKTTCIKSLRTSPQN